MDQMGSIVKPAGDRLSHVTLGAFEIGGRHDARLKTTNGAQWTLTYSRPSSRNDVGYFVEYSTDLTTWTSGSATHQRIETTASSETWNATVSSGNQVFFRLRVEKS